MRNNEICNLLGGVGIFLACVSLIAYFFGIIIGLPACFLGMALSALALFNYE